MKRAMEALAAGPGNSSLMAVIPKATKVRSVVLKEKTAFVDFSAEIANVDSVARPPRFWLWAPS